MLIIKKIESEVVSFSVHCLMTCYVYNSSHNCMGNNIVVVLLVLVKICHIMTQRGFMLYSTIHTQTFDPSFVHWRLGVKHNFQKYFSYYFCGRNWITQRKPQICRKSLKNLYHILFYQVHLAMHRVQTHNISGDRQRLHR